MELTGTEKHRYCNRNERAEWITGYRSSGLRPALPGAVRRAARPEAACSRDSPCSQPRGHSTANGGLHLTAKPDVPRRPESHHRHGSSACPTGVSHAEVWSAVRRQRRGILRAKKPPTANRVRQKESRPTRAAGHTSPCLKLSLSLKKFLEKLVVRRRDSATRARTPPGPSNRAKVAIKWMNRTTRLASQNA